MKTWGVACGLLSGALLAMMIASMHSCSDTYDIGPEGQLWRPPLTETGQGTKSSPRISRDWSAEFPKFPGIQRWVLPGDRVEETTTTAGLWIFEVRMTSLEVIRGNESVLLARDGHVRFWGTILGVSLLPMISWGIGAISILTLTPRRPRPPAG